MAGGAYRALVAGDAVLALDDVKIGGHLARVYAFADRIEIIDHDGLRVVALTDVARITTKSGLRHGRVTVITSKGETIEIRNLKAADTPVAFRLLVGLARDANP